MSNFKNEHVVLDQDNKEAHYQQIVKIIEAEGLTFYNIDPLPIQDALRVELYKEGTYWLSGEERTTYDPERHIPFVPEVKQFKDEYIMLDLDNKDAHYEQVVKVLKSEGKKDYWRPTFSNDASHIRCFRDGEFAHYQGLLSVADGEERKLPYIPTPERLTLTDNILTVDGKVRYTLTEIEEVEEVEPEEKEFTIRQVFSAVNHFSNNIIWIEDVRKFLNDLDA